MDNIKLASAMFELGRLEGMIKALRLRAGVVGQKDIEKLEKQADKLAKELEALLK